MIRDTKLSGLLHVLLHMAHHEGPVTSEALARAMSTNAAVIRRIMAGLRDRGYVASTRGHGGGWVISCDFEAVTLRDVYEAIGAPALIGLGHRSEAPECLVEQAVNHALGETFEAAQALLLARFGEISLAALSADFHARLAARGGGVKDISHDHRSHDH